MSDIQTSELDVGQPVYMRSVQTGRWSILGFVSAHSKWRRAFGLRSIFVGLVHERRWGWWRRRELATAADKAALDRAAGD